jgi:hypothetical protein
MRNADAGLAYCVMTYQYTMWLVKTICVVFKILLGSQSASHWVIKAICTHARKTIYGICKRKFEVSKHSGECVVEEKESIGEGRGGKESI